MTYNLFPAVDENFDFPEDVRVQLAKSEQLRNLVIPMTETARDNLTLEELWFGRTIYNTTADTLESWKSPGAWVTYLDDTYSFPEPPPFWDENYDVPVEVRTQLAKSVELRNLITPMTEVARDALSSSERWNGRTIFNKTANRLETWKTYEGAWVPHLDDTYVPPVDEWQDYTPLLTYSNSSTVLSNQTAVGRYIQEGLLITYYFKVSFSGAINASQETKRLWLSKPVGAYENSGISHVGLATIDTTPIAGGGRFFGSAMVWNTGGTNPDPIVFEYNNSSGNAVPVTNIAPNPWGSGCTIEGQIIYEVGA